MKKFLAFLFCAATLVGFAGCSDDDEDEGENVIDNPAALVGYWQAVEFRFHDDLQTEVDTESGIVFQFDGTNCTVYKTGELVSQCPYLYDTASHTLQFLGDGVYRYSLYTIPSKVQVEELTTNKLMILGHPYDPVVTVTVKFRRIDSL